MRSHWCGLPLPVIQLIARWSSDVIARYVGEAPLGSITALYRGCATPVDLGLEAGPLRAAQAALRGDLDAFRFSVTKALGEERAFRALQDRDAPINGLRASPPFVTSCTRTVHMVATRLLSATPVFEWRAACGWQFGLATYTLCSTPPAASPRCGRCWRRAEPDDESR